MAYALAAVALGVVLQSVSLGVAPKAYTDDGFNSTGSGALSGLMDASTPEVNEDGALVASSNLAWTPQEPSHLDLDVLGNYPKIFGNSQSSLVEAASARVSAQGGQLSEAEAIAVLEAAGWPTELIPQALAVAWCESKWSPGARGDSGRSVGWFQLNLATWFPYAREDPSMWADPLVNARVALATYRYDIAKGYAPWQQWSCRSALY